MKITMEGVEEVRVFLRDLVPAASTEVIRQMATIAFDSAEEAARSHTKTGPLHGALLQSLYNRQIDGGPGREVGHDPVRAPHALFVNFGTKPHKIEPKLTWSPKNPKRRAALRWTGPNGYIFARVVNHPGYIGDPYMPRAADEAVAQFQAIVEKTLKGLG